MSQQPKIAWLQGWSFTPDVWGDIAAQLPGYKHIFIEDPASYIPVEQQILVGWSLGAMHAIALAAKYPKRITHLVVIAGTLQFCPEDRTLGWPRRIVQRMIDALQQAPDQVVQQFRSQLSNDEPLLALPSPSLAQLTEGLTYLRDSNLQNDWNQLTLPRLWIHGDADTICPIAAAPTNINLVRLPGVGHIPFEHESCWHEIRRWLDENS
jgi:pimeloyl-[acyl-carrier protein] methyl ester esterase